jgi:hypothetical protein
MLSETNLLALTQMKFEIWVTHNLDQLSEIFDDKGLLFDNHGKIDTKEGLLEKLSSENCILKKYDFRNTVARVFETSAVVYGEGEFTFSIFGENKATKLNFLDVWVERENGWKLVSTHYNYSS